MTEGSHEPALKGLQANAHSVAKCFASVLTHILGFHPAAVSDKESTGELNMLRNKILCFLQPFTLIPPSTKYLRFSLGVKFPF